MEKGFTRAFRPLDVLSEEQIERIHLGTLNILQQVGVQILDIATLKLLESNGCHVDYDAKRAHIPPEVVAGCMRQVPPSFHVKARDAKDDLLIGGDRVYFRNFAGMDTVDLNSWEPHPPSREQYYDLVTILDALPHIHALSCYPYFGFKGLPEVMKLSEGEAAKARNSTKIQIVCYSKGSEVFSIRIVQAAGGEAFGISHPASPLAYYPDAIQAIYNFTEAGWPMHVGSGVIMGATGPATIAGSTVSNNAEIVAQIVLIQLVRPGSRIIVNDFVHAQNMRTGSPAFGDIAATLHVAAFHQIWRWYGIPTCTSSTGVSSSKEIDFQLAYEKTIPALVAALSGSNIIDLHSSINGELTAHPVQAILDDDVAGMIGRLLEGIRVDDDTLAIDLIQQVGPVPGHFLATEHTRRWWKQEWYMPRVADRTGYAEWKKDGKKSALVYAKERCESLLATHKAIPLTDGQEAEIESILDEERSHYKKQGLWV